MYFKPGDDAFDFIRDLSGNKEKFDAVFNYTFCKERFFDSYYELDPHDYVDDFTREFDNAAFKSDIANREVYIRQCEADFKASGAHLKQLGIDPIIIEALQLNTFVLSDISKTLQELNTMNSNTNKPSNADLTEPLRKLPILVIHDTEFYVDMAKNEFRQVDNARNSISFDNVQDNRDHSAILYDPVTKNAFQGTKQQAGQRADVILVRLPAPLDLDPEFFQKKLEDGMKKLLNKLEHDVRQKQDKQTRKPSKGMSI
jgi:hypothetical protein